MGMGEPFDNYDAVMRAVAVLTDVGGLGFGPSRITISTSGRVDAILRMVKEADPALNLAVLSMLPTMRLGIGSCLSIANGTWQTKRGDVGVLQASAERNFDRICAS